MNIILANILLAMIAFGMAWAFCAIAVDATKHAKESYTFPEFIFYTLLMVVFGSSGLTCFAIGLSAILGG